MSSEMKLKILLALIFVIVNLMTVYSKSAKWLHAVINS